MSIKKNILMGFAILSMGVSSLLIAGEEAEPKRGLSMDDVVKSYGEPSVKHDAVGVPPIIRWVYEDVVVYFEGEYVIHTVKNSK